jgi:transposase InsO family protein
MRANGLGGKLRGEKKRTAIPDEAAAEKARDLLQRDRHHLHPHLARLRRSRVHPRLLQPQIVGWQLAAHMRAELVTDALEMANDQRPRKDGDVTRFTPA